ncbi:MAG: M16 family metallopeptidase, partial [Ilumatobacteraceae bacterium]
MAERVVRLDSGLTVAVDEMASTRSASIGVWVGVGSRDEPDQSSGVSHFLEHLLFKGTDRRSARDISRSVDRVGGDINAYTAKEHT